MLPHPSQNGIALFARLALVLFILPSIGSAEDGPGLYPCKTNRIEVMFDEGSRVRLREAGLVDLTGNALAGVSEALALVEEHRWSRLCDVPEETLDEMQRRGEAETGEALYNMNNIYRLSVPRGTDVWKLCEELESLPGVLRAMPSPKPTAPPVYDYEYMQVYLDPASAYPTGIDAEYSWTVAGGTGAGVTVADLEYSWNRNHADLPKLAYPSCEINPNTLVDPFNDDHHGTAVVGELVSTRNGWGTSGVCYGANLRTCGTYYIVVVDPPDTTWDVAGAVIMAAAALSPGDVILIEQQWDYNDPNTTWTDYIPIEWWGSTWPNAQTANPVYTAIASAVANGISVVEAGGNGGNAVGTGYDTGTLTWQGDSGAIIVGAGGAYPGGNWPSTDLERLGFSSYGPRFDLQGQGEDVATAGYGHLYNQGGYDSLFTHIFSGTSSASPIVAGAVVDLVAHWKATISSTPPTPAYIRSLLKSTGTPQVFGNAGNIGPRPNLLAAYALLGSGWADVTTAPISDWGKSTGVAWGDYDNDGDLDMYLSKTWGEANRLFRNDGGGAFTDVASGPEAATGDNTASAWGDYDNDGDLDLYVSEVNGGTDLLLRNDSGVFADVTPASMTDTGNGMSVAWADYDNDGDLDVYVGNYPGGTGSSANKLYRNDGGDLFADVTTPPLDNGGSTSVSWADYDDDGDMDIYLGDYATTNRLYRNEGGGLFVDVTPYLLANAGTTLGIAWGDYDNDGDLDLYVANGTSAYPNKLFQNQGGGVFTDVTAPPLADNNPSYCAVWGDYNNDGLLDLYVSNYSAANRLYKNMGAGVFVDYAIDPPCDGGTGLNTAFGDYDNDGDIDLYLSDYSYGDKLFRNEGGSAWSWLHVDLVGSTSNRYGIGARITVISGSGTPQRIAQVREVITASGYMSAMNSITAEFGFGSVGLVDTVEVRWPSGAVTTRTGVAANQAITMNEVNTAVADNAPVAGSARLHRNVPNPFNPATTISFTLPSPRTVDLRVYDIGGRLVRTLVDGESGSGGVNSVVWDGGDNDGRPVASGVYFYRIETGPYTESRKMVLIR